MRLEIVYEDGVWSFTITSLDPSDDYIETFELTDLAEAQDTAWDLMKDLTKAPDTDEDDLFDEIFRDDC